MLQLVLILLFFSFSNVALAYEVPLRITAEAIGFEVTWDVYSKSAKMFNPMTQESMIFDQTNSILRDGKLYVDEKEVKLFQRPPSITSNTPEQAICRLGDKSPIGSAFAVSPRILVTAYHVVRDTPNLKCEFTAANSEVTISRIVYYSTKDDIAILYSDKPIYDYLLLTDNLPEKAFMAGYHLQKKVYTSTDDLWIITTQKDTQGLYFDEANIMGYDAYGRITANADGRFGQSGGPLISFNKVFGVTVATSIFGNTFYYVPSKVVVDILKDIDEWNAWQRWQKQQPSLN